MTAAPGKYHFTRRQVMIAGVGAAGSLVIGLPVLAYEEGGERMLGFFVEINADGSVVVGCKDPEIGQSLRTAIPMMVAEELDIAWEKVRIEQMPLGIVRTADGYTWKYGGQGVGGSTGLRFNWDLMRQAGADARRQLILAAARRFGMDPSQCDTRPGFVVCAARDIEIPYSELVIEAATLPTPEDPAPLKAMHDYRIIGTRRRTIDARDIVTGRAMYGIDTVQPDMRYAVIARAPVLNARVRSFDDSKAREIDGVLDVFEVDGPKPGEPYVILASGVAVVATSTWAAMRGRAALEIVWEQSPNADDSSERFWRQNEEMLKGDGQVVLDDGDFDAAMTAATTTIKRRYRVPFVSHAPLEPQNCYAFVKTDECHIIAPTQMPAGASRAAHAVTGIPRENIRVEMTRVPTSTRILASLLDFN